VAFEDDDFPRGGRMSQNATPRLPRFTAGFNAGMQLRCERHWKEEFVEGSFPQTQTSVPSPPRYGDRSMSVAVSLASRSRTALWT
jgi:hypothetical protein